MQDLLLELENRYADDPIHLSLINELKKRQAMPTGTYPPLPPTMMDKVKNWASNDPTLGIIEGSAAQVAPFTVGLAAEAVGGLGALSGLAQGQSLEEANRGLQQFREKAQPLV